MSEAGIEVIKHGQSFGNAKIFLAYLKNIIGFMHNHFHVSWWSIGEKQERETQVNSVGKLVLR